MSSSKKKSKGVTWLDVIKAFFWGQPIQKHDLFQVVKAQVELDIARAKVRRLIHKDDKFFELLEELCKLEEIADALPECELKVELLERTAVLEETLVSL